MPTVTADLEVAHYWSLRLTDRAVTTSGRVTPGVNVDRVDLDAGAAMAVTLGYATARDNMVVRHGLARWARGEEDGAIRSLVGNGVDLTSAYMIVAAARAAAEATSIAAEQAADAARQAEEDTHCADCGGAINTLLWGGVCGTCLDAAMYA